MYNPSIINRNLEKANKNGFATQRRPVNLVEAEAEKFKKLWNADKGNYIRALTKAEEEFIRSEQTLCRFDFQYCAERYLYIEKDAMMGGGIGLPTLSKSQHRILNLLSKRELEMWGEFDANGQVNAGILAIVHKVRQVFATALSRMLLMHRMMFHKNYRVLSATLASPEDGNKKILYDRDMILYDNLPPYLKPRMQYLVKKEQIQFEKLGRGVYTDSEQRAGIGTGNQFDGHHITEGALWNNLDRLIFSFLPGIPKGTNVLGIWESTANGRNDTWHTMTESVRHRKRGYENWVYCFIPYYLMTEKYSEHAPEGWSPEPFTLKHADMVEHTSPEFSDGRTVRLTRDQLYWWETLYMFHKDRRQLGMFYSNYPATPEESFQSVQRAALPYEVLESVRMGAHLKGVPYEVKLGLPGQSDGDLPKVTNSGTSKFPNNFFVGRRGSVVRFPMELYDDDPRGLLWLWEPIDTLREKYCLGIDPSQGIPGWSRDTRNDQDGVTDNSAISIWKAGRGDRKPVQVGEYVAPIDAFDCGYVANIIGRIFGREDEDGQAEVIHEAYPGPGPGTTRTLMECGYTNIWRWAYFADAVVKPTQTIGWQASPRNNEQLWSKCNRIISLGQADVKSPWLYEEMANLIILPGKHWAEVLPGDDRHDDRWRAACLALWCVMKWSLDAETIQEVVRTTPDPMNWAACAMSIEEIHDEWNRHVDEMWG